MNKGRILTLVIEITDESAYWVYDTHMDGLLHDMKVKSICEGNLVKELDLVQDKLYDYTDPYGDLD